MHRSLIAILVLAVLAPLSLEIQSDGESSWVEMPNGTRVEVLGGVGEYAFVSRGCEGQILDTDVVKLRDAGMLVEQGFGDFPVRLGVRGGVIRERAQFDSGVLFDPNTGTYVPFDGRVTYDNRYVNPYLSYVRPAGSVGFGWVFHDIEFLTAGEGSRDQSDHPANDFSAHLRIGSPRRYFAIQWMEGVPISSGGGYLTLGIGGQPRDARVHLFGGLGAGGPYEGAGLALQASYALSPQFSAHLRSRLGYSGGKGASGVALGLGFGPLAR
jgi:hypothetical protein